MMPWEFLSHQLYFGIDRNISCVTKMIPSWIMILTFQWESEIAVVDWNGNDRNGT